MNTQSILTGLFDFQRFAHNPGMQSIIDDIEDRYGITEMTDDELDSLAAAGDPFGLEYPRAKRDGVT